MSIRTVNRRATGCGALLAMVLLGSMITGGCGRPTGSVTGTVKDYGCQVVSDGSLAGFLTLQENPTNHYFVSSRIAIKYGIVRDVGGGNVETVSVEGWKVQIDYRNRKKPDGTGVGADYDVVRLKLR